MERNRVTAQPEIRVASPSGYRRDAPMNPIFVAIDTARPSPRPRAGRATSDGQACGLKLGLEFFCANGEAGVLRVAEHRLPLVP